MYMEKISWFIDELLLIFLKALTKSKRSLHDTQNALVFGLCVVTELSIAPTISIQVISLQASSPRNALDLPTARGEHLVFCGLYCTDILIFTDVTEHVTALYSMVNSKYCTKNSPPKNGQ